MRLKKILVNGLIFYSLSILSGCGRIASTAGEPHSVAAALPQHIGMSTIVFDTILNILRNSLLEVILFLIVVVLFVRYRPAGERKNSAYKNHNDDNRHNVLSYNNDFDYSNWYFDEDSRK